MKKYAALFTGIIILLLINYSIYQKERHLSEGKVVYLQLAPVDPRSLMQGDYMALRFKMANDIYAILPKDLNSAWTRDVQAADGKAVVKLDNRGVASFVRIDNGGPLADGELRLRYRVRDGRLKFATNAFFFQEGKAAVYEKARYGQFRVDQDGELLLVHMCDDQLAILGQ